MMSNDDVFDPTPPIEETIRTRDPHTVVDFNDFDPHLETIRSLELLLNHYDFLEEELTNYHAHEIDDCWIQEKFQIEEQIQNKIDAINHPLLNDRDSVRALLCLFKAHEHRQFKLLDPSQTLNDISPIKFAISDLQKIYPKEQELTRDLSSQEIVVVEQTINMELPLLVKSGYTYTTIVQKNAVKTKQSLPVALDKSEEEAMERMQEKIEEELTSRFDIFLNAALPELEITTSNQLSSKEVATLLSDLGVKSAHLLHALKEIMHRSITDEVLFSETHKINIQKDLSDWYKDVISNNTLLLAGVMLKDMSFKFIDRLQNKDKKIFTETHMEDISRDLQEFIKNKNQVVGRLINGLVAVMIPKKDPSER